MKTPLLLFLLTLLPGCILYAQSNSDVQKAIKTNDNSTLEAWIASTSDINQALDKDGFTALHIAARAQNSMAVELLLAAQANPNIQAGKDRATPLFLFCASLSPKKGYDLLISEMLLRFGADPTLPNAKGFLPIHAAAEFGATDVVEQLLATGIDPNVTCAGCKGAPLLFFAVGFNKIETAQFLIEKGAKINATDNEGQTALHLAAANNFAVCAQLLLEFGADPNKADNKKQTPFYLAATNKSFDLGVIEFFLQKGANPKTKTPNGEPLIQVVGQKVYGLLFDYGAED